MRCLSLALLGLSLASCGMPASAPRPVRPSVNVISREELARSPASDLLTLILNTRPTWIHRADRATIDVYELNSRIGGVSELSSYPPSQLESVELLSAAQADIRLPDSRGRPVILLEPKR